MLHFLARRLLHAAAVVFLVVTATFAIVHLAPGGPALLADPKLSEAERAVITVRLGLDRPLGVQYVRWMSRAVRGDLGNSFLYQTPALRTIAERVPNTLLLSGAALALTLLVALPLGRLAGARLASGLDRVFSALSFLTMAVPTFWLAIVCIFVFAVVLHLLPAGGAQSAGQATTLADRLRHLILPAVVLSASGSAELFRYARSGMAQAVGQPFVLTARALGAPRARVRRHAFRNAFIPIITVIGLQLPRLIGGAAITETVFAWPGMGRLGIEAALARDYPLVMAVTVLVSMGVVTISIVVDLAYAWADPRVRIAPR